MGELHDTTRPLHEQQPTSRFSERVRDYVKFRPGYPPEAFDAMCVDLPEEATAADVGAGTGISTRVLATRCRAVWAVEPNRDMAAAAEPVRNVMWLHAPAEATTLPDQSLDLVLAAQAFHWFKRDDALREFHRILKPGGRLALLWNMRDPADPVASAYTRVIREFGNEHPAEMRDFQPQSVLDTTWFDNLHQHEFQNEQALDEAGFVGRAFSASYVPKSGPRAAEIDRQLRRVHVEHCDSRGIVRLRYLVPLFLFQSRV